MELSDIGKTTEKAVDKALSQSREFLGRLTDVDGVFYSSRTACLRLGDTEKQSCEDEGQLG